MEQGVYTSAEMRCPTFEIRIAGPQLDAETVLTDPAAFAQTVTAGRDAADAWFNTAEGLQFLATARRAAPPDTLEMAPPAPRIGPQPYVVRVLSASVAPAKPSGEPWDASDYGVADPLVQIEVTQQGSGRLRTPTAQDTLTPTWDAQADMMLGSGSLLRVTVWDADAVFNDRIVSFDVPFAGAKRYVLSEPTSSLSELVIDIQPEADAATSVIPQAAAASGSH
ncbi:MAG TPA: C2 domain-containing protein [Polyangiales bacterium]|nr:C2 domain-containing protein [Polyangiales bacterium]